MMSWLGTLKTAASAARRVPPVAYAVAFGIGLAVAAWQWHTTAVGTAVTAAVDTDRAARAAAAELYVATVLQTERQAAAWRVAAATERADSANAARDRAVARTRRVEQQLATRLKVFDVAITALPDSLRDLPEVTRVVGACTALAQDCAQLREAITRERAATDAAVAEGQAERTARLAQQAVADSTIAVMGATVSALTVRIEQAERRPTWKRVLAVGGGALATIAVATVHLTRGTR